jgi:hypothetical protein
MDKEVLLHIIDGPGATWGWMVFTLVAGFVIIFLVRTLNGYEVGFREGRAAERRERLNAVDKQVG